MRRRGATNVSRVTFERRQLRIAKLLAGFQQARVGIASAPVHLVDSPRNDRRFRECLNRAGIFPGQRLPQRRAFSDKLGERRLVEIVDARIEGGHGGNYDGGWRVEGGQWRVDSRRWSVEI